MLGLEGLAAGPVGPYVGIVQDSRLWVSSLTSRVWQIRLVRLQGGD